MRIVLSNSSDRDKKAILDLPLFESDNHVAIININKEDKKPVSIAGGVNSYEIRYFDEYEKEIDSQFIKALYINDEMNDKNESINNVHFEQYYGLIQLAIEYKQNDKVIRYCTDYFLLKNSKIDGIAKRMTEYVFDRYETLLFSKPMFMHERAGAKENSYKTFQYYIFLLDEIAETYKKNYPFYRTGSKFKSESKESVGEFEKLRYITPKTIDYIGAHPEQLVQVDDKRFIKINEKYYYPKKTLIYNTVYSYDIFENRCVVGFLVYLYNYIAKLKKELCNERKLVESWPNLKRYYEALIKNLSKVEHKYVELVGLYEQAHDVSLDATVGEMLPMQTQIFMEIPQYREYYEEMVKWFKFGVVKFGQYDFILSFLKTDVLYELFSLCHLVEAIKDMGFSLKNQEIDYYEFLPPNKDKPIEVVGCNNYFPFKNDNGDILELFYQPIIYSGNIDPKDKCKPNSGKQPSPIALFRNTSFGYINEDNYDNRKFGVGNYYTPDYVIKVKKHNNIKTRYALLDAKFSLRSTVIKQRLMGLLYKYLFSISTHDEGDIISGLLVLNGLPGKSDEDKKDVGIFDLLPNTGDNNRFPVVKILTLTGDDKYTDNSQIVKDCLAQYI